MRGTYRITKDFGPESKWFQRLKRRFQKRAHGDCSHQNKEQTNRKTDVTKSASSAIAGSDTPLGREQPQPICEVPRGAKNSHGVEGHCPRMLKFQLHFTEGGSGMCQQVDAAEAQMPGMPGHIEKGDGAGPTLSGIHPVARPRVVHDVGISAIPDIEAVKGVIQNGKPDLEEFESYDERVSSQRNSLFRIRARPSSGEGVGNQMYDQKESSRTNSAKRVQAAK